MNYFEGQVVANFEWVGRDQWDLLEQAALEGAVVDQVDLGAVDYLLGTGESYGQTAQHTQDSPTLFIQLNYCA